MGGNAEGSRLGFFACFCSVRQAGAKARHAAIVCVRETERGDSIGGRRFATGGSAASRSIEGGSDVVIQRRFRVAGRKKRKRQDMVKGKPEITQCFDLGTGPSHKKRDEHNNGPDVLLPSRQVIFALADRLSCAQLVCLTT